MTAWPVLHKAGTICTCSAWSTACQFCKQQLTEVRRKCICVCSLVIWGVKLLGSGQLVSHILGECEGFAGSWLFCMCTWWVDCCPVAPSLVEAWLKFLAWLPDFIWALLELHGCKRQPSIESSIFQLNSRVKSSLLQPNYHLICGQNLKRLKL